jgi:tRNA G18 (ribose-2'-O)-methylase SpoU
LVVDEIFVFYGIYMWHKHTIIMENLRSAYNVGNILRTADALGRDACCSWFTPHPEQEMKVQKTALWALHQWTISQFWNTAECCAVFKNAGYTIVAGEITSDALYITDIATLSTIRHNAKNPIALIVWSETHGVLEDTLWRVDYTIAIPMQWVKESLNVGQAAAIMMRELSKV